MRATLSKTPSRGLITIAAAFLCASCALDDGWERIDKELSNSPVGIGLREAAIVGPDLWVRGYSTIVRYRMSDWVPVQIGHNVVDMAVAPEGLWVLRAPLLTERNYDAPGSFRVALWDGEQWFQSQSLPYPAKQRPVAVADTALGPVVVTRTALQSLNRDLTARSRIVLRTSLEEHLVDAASSAVVDGDWLYLGFAKGEWGGGIRRIHLETGEVDQVQRRGGDVACTGPLDPQCDPVTALIPSPTRSGCLEAAVMQRHIFERGHLVRLCDGKVVGVFERPKDRLGDRLTAYLNFGREPFGSEGFSSLSADSDGYWALSSRNAYRFADGWVTRHALPKLRRVNGIAVSNDLDGKLIIAAHPDQRFPRIFAQHWQE